HFWVTPNSGFMRRTRRRGVASGPLYWMRGRSLLRARLALAEGGGDQLFLLGEVLVEIPDRGRGGRRTTGVAELLARGQRLADVVLHVEPVALVLRLVLAPDDLRRGSEALELGLERLVREGVELLDADDRHIVRVALAPGRDEIVVDASGAQDHPLHAGRVDRRIGLADDGLEAARGEGLERRRRLLVPQQRLGREDDERLADEPDHLLPQQVEDLRRRGRLADLHVVLGAQLQEAFRPSRGVLRALPLVAVRQHQRKAGHPPPLRLAGG